MNPISIKDMEYPVSEFLFRTINDSCIVLGGKAKFIPQAMHFDFTILATYIILD
jgi:hypothetical protein